MHELRQQRRSEEIFDYQTKNFDGYYTPVSDFLRQYTVPDLRKFLIYLSHFQGYPYDVPLRAEQSRKAEWVINLTHMLQDKPPPEPISYIERIMNIVTWFKNQKVSFRVNMDSRNGTFFKKILNDFGRKMTDTVIQLESEDGSKIDILRSDIHLCNIEDKLITTPNITLEEQKRKKNGKPKKLDSLTIVDEPVTKATSILECKVCLTNKICIALTVCGHTFCHSCISRLKSQCAICRISFKPENCLRIYIEGEMTYDSDTSEKITKTPIKKVKGKKQPK